MESGTDDGRAERAVWILLVGPNREVKTKTLTFGISHRCKIDFARRHFSCCSAVGSIDSQETLLAQQMLTRRFKIGLHRVQYAAL
jgi:hypothetical protein